MEKLVISGSDFFACSSAISLIAQYIPQFHAKALKPVVKTAEGLVQDHDTQIEKKVNPDISNVAAYPVDFTCLYV